MADFPYAGDVGVHSYDAIIAFEHTSGIPFTVSSTYRPGDPGYHGKGNAVDAYNSPANMVKLAQWWTQFTPFLLELIHSGGGGYFVKNGKPVSASYYGAATVSQHYNHVHVAVTNSGLNAIRSGNPASGGSVPAGQLITARPARGKGCLLPATGGGAVAISAIGSAISVTTCSGPRRKLHAYKRPAGKPVCVDCVYAWNAAIGGYYTGVAY
jgi:hypothetical protein